MSRLEKERLNQEEISAVLDLAGAMSILQSERLNLLEPLLALVPGGKRDMGMLKKKSEKLLEDICMVIPEATLRSMKGTLKHVRCHVGVPMLGRENIDRETGWVVSFADLTVLTAACYDKCMMYGRTGGEISKCQLRKTFKNLPTPDEPEPMGGGCGYRRIIMEGGEVK